RRHEVLAGDQLESTALPIDLVVDEARDLWIRLGEPSFRHRHLRRGPLGRSCGLGHQISFKSIFSTRRSWRPPSNLASSHTFMVSTAFSSDMKREGRTRTFELLCLRESSPISGSQASAARTP